MAARLTTRCRVMVLAFTGILLGGGCGRQNSAWVEPSLVTLGGPEATGGMTADANALASDLAVGAVKIARAAILAAPGTNVVVAPFPLQLAAGMSYLATSGSIADQVAAGMNWRQTPAVFQDAMGPLLGVLAADVADANHGVVVQTATRLWVDERLSLSPAFAAALSGVFGAPAASLPMAASPTTAASLANAWAGRQTAGGLQQVLPPGSPAPTNRILATAATSLSAIWSAPLAVDSARLLPFTTGAGIVRSVVPLRLTASLSLRDTEDYQAVRLPLAVGGLSVVFVRPRDDVATLLSSLDIDDLGREMMADGDTLAAVDVTLPRFETHQGLGDARDLLSNIGAGALFAVSAETRSFAGDADPGPTAAVEAVYGQARIRLDEWGISVDPASVSGSPPAPAAASGTAFVLDRPFLFAVVHAATGTVLSMGAVRDPTND